MSRKKIYFDYQKPNILESYLIQAYRGALLFAIEHNWEVCYRQNHFGQSLPINSYHELIEEGIDGVLFDYISSEKAEELSQTGLCSVNIGGHSYSDQFPAVHQDNHKIGELGANHFIERQFVNLAYAGCNRIPSSESRRKGFMSTIESSGLEADYFAVNFKRSVYLSYTDWAEGVSNLIELRSWLESLPKPVAIMCYHDALALIIMRLCQQIKLNVPNDVAILGVQEFSLLENSPLLSLSSIDHSAHECGYAAAKLLAERLDAPNKPVRQIIVPPNGIVQRQSTDVIAISHPLVKKALKFIEENLEKQITTNDVAHYLSCSRSTLSRHFKAILKRSVSDELKRLRLERSKIILKDTTLTLKEIALLCGFVDSSHFSKVFYASVGMPPGKWRIKY